VRGGIEAAYESDIERLYWPQSSTGTGTRLRILFVAPKYDYGDIRRGYGIEENYFLHSLLSMGHQVIRFDSVGISKRRGRRLAGELLTEAVVREQPDVMFSVLFRDEFEPQAIASATAMLDGRTVNWFCDDQWRWDSYTAYWAPLFGWSATTTESAIPKYQGAGISRVILTQWGCNHYLYRPLPLDHSIDVSFVGQPHGDRARAIEAIRRAGISVETWGFGWPRGKLSQAGMLRLYSQTKINLNLSNASRGRADQIKGRDFEIPGCRGFLITKDTVELGNYFLPGQEVATYESTTDLIDKIRHYLARESERDAIAAAGYARTLAEHTVEARLNAIFSTVLGRPVAARA
jgi:spore maturation protein CgeB